MLNAPVGSEIHIDQQFAGHSTGNPTLVKVQPGPRTVEVFLTGYQTWKQVVMVEPGRQANVTANLIPIRAVAVPATAGLASAGSGSALSDADLALIHQLLTLYETAVNNKDLKQLKAAWPEIPPRKVEEYKSLPRGSRITLTLTKAILLEGNENAIVKCRQDYELNGKLQGDNVTFYVGRLNSGWIINQIPSSN